MLSTESLSILKGVAITKGGHMSGNISKRFSASLTPFKNIKNFNVKGAHSTKQSGGASGTEKTDKAGKTPRPKSVSFGEGKPTDRIDKRLSVNLGTQNKDLHDRNAHKSGSFKTLSTKQKVATILEALGGEVKTADQMAAEVGELLRNKDKLHSFKERFDVKTSKELKTELEKFKENFLATNDGKKTVNSLIAGNKKPTQTHPETSPIQSSKVDELDPKDVTSMLEEISKDDNLKPMQEKQTVSATPLEQEALSITDSHEIEKPLDDLLAALDTTLGITQAQDRVDGAANQQTKPAQLVDDSVNDGNFMSEINDALDDKKFVQAQPKRATPEETERRRKLVAELTAQTQPQTKPVQPQKAPKTLPTPPQKAGQPQKAPKPLPTPPQKAGQPQKARKPLLTPPENTLEEPWAKIQNEFAELTGVKSPEKLDTSPRAKSLVKAKSVVPKTQITPPKIDQVVPERLSPGFENVNDLDGLIGIFAKLEPEKKTEKK